MTDITKCSGELHGMVCDLRDSCWRYIAPMGQMQSMFSEAPFKVGHSRDQGFFNTCEHQLPWKPIEVKP